MIAAPNDNITMAAHGHATSVVGTQGRSDVEPLEAASRRARGRDLRKAVHRRDHAVWKPGTERPDPIDLLEAQARFLQPDDVHVRNKRLLQSPLAFFQVANIVMVSDLANAPATGIQVQLCGDAQPANFAIFNTLERPLLFDIVDFDETLPGPWEWDVKRLATSLVVAARVNGINAVKRHAIVLSALSSYRHRMRTLATMRLSDLWYWNLPEEDILEFLAQYQRHQQRHRRPSESRDDPPLENVAELGGPVGDRSDSDSVSVSHAGTDALTRTVRGVLRAYRRTLEGHQQQFLKGFELVDATLRVETTAGMGARRYVALLERLDGESLLLELTESRASLLTRHLPNSVFRNQGKRIATGQRLIGAVDDLLLGWVRDDNGRDYHIRRARVPTVAIDPGSLSARSLVAYASLCGAALARAHARSGDRISIAAYLGKGDRFDRAIAGFAESYADQIERDHQALVRALRAGRIKSMGYRTDSPRRVG
ncbi:MAG: DUF2252 domain-containing protein [Dehalococcoidia bacterium]